MAESAASKRYRKSAKGIATQRAYWERNREKILAQKRARYQETREQRAEYGRKRYAESRDEIRAQQQEYRQANGAAIKRRQRSWYVANSKRVQERVRANGLKRWHGLDAASFAEQWDAQHGKCYLCGRDLIPKKAAVDHWHGCSAHDPSVSCRYCQRGIACHACNMMIGMARDDPDLLRLVADNLEAANSYIQELQKQAPTQLTLGEELSGN